jgi:hypothetical protein
MAGDPLSLLQWRLELSCQFRQAALDGADRRHHFQQLRFYNHETCEANDV